MIELDNSEIESDGLYTFETRRAMGSAPFYGEFLKKYGEISVYLTYNSETTRQMYMLADEWTVKEGESANGSCYDEAVVLQGTPAPNIVFADISPIQAIWRVLDFAGFSNFKIRHLAGVKLPVIDWFYCNDSQTVWDVIKSVCYSHQCSVWIDSDGVINIASKEWIFNGTRPVAWAINATETVSPDAVADMESHEETTLEPVNTVNVKYTPIREYRKNDPGGPARGAVANLKEATSPLFSPENPILLGATDLMGPITASSKTMVINPNALTTSQWAGFSGYCIVDQEIIKYDGLRFKYVDKDTLAVRHRIVKNNAEMQELYLSAQGRVNFTGELMNLERGQFGTRAWPHQRWQRDWAVSNAKYVFQSSGVFPPGVTICNPAAVNTPDVYVGMFKNLSSAPGSNGSLFRATKLNKFSARLTLGQLKTKTEKVDGIHISQTTTVPE
jgi:hypothetical protein